MAWKHSQFRAAFPVPPYTTNSSGIHSYNAKENHSYVGSRSPRSRPRGRARVPSDTVGPQGRVSRFLLRFDLQPGLPLFQPSLRVTVRIAAKHSFCASFTAVRL